MDQWSRDIKGERQQAAADVIMLLARGICEQVREAIGNGVGWMCRDQVWQAMGSVR